MLNRRIHANIAATLLSATLAFTAIPFAASAADAPSATVQTGDLNLGTEAGRAVLKRRIDSAVENVCGFPSARGLTENQAYTACAKTARASAMPQYDAMVSAAQSGKKVAADRNSASSVQ